MYTEKETNRNRFKVAQALVEHGANINQEANVNSTNSLNL